MGDDRYREAVGLFRFGAERRIAQSQHLLAVMYEYGLGVEQSYAQALLYYRQAAEQNYVESVYHLALMYAYGRGCTQDFLHAMSLLQRAARDKHAPASYYVVSTLVPVLVLLLVLVAQHGLLISVIHHSPFYSMQLALYHLYAPCIFYFSKLYVVCCGL